MKKYFSIYIISLFAFVIACQDYSPDIPDACLTISVVSGYNDNGQPIYVETNTCKVGENVIFSACSPADKFAVYTGKAGSVYGETGATGTSLSSATGAIVITTYTTAGTYTVTLVATNFSTGSVDIELSRNTDTKQLTVIE